MSIKNNSEVIKNNYEVIKNNSEIIKSNSEVIKNNFGGNLVAIKNNLGLQIIVFYSIRGGSPLFLKPSSGYSSILPLDMSTNVDILSLADQIG